MTTTTTFGVPEIAELFPNLMDIQCENLRENVAATWNEAITTGCGGKGWTFDELRAVKFTLLAGNIEMTFIEHLNSCVRQCIAIADVLQTAFTCDIPVDRDILIAGALLADSGKPLEFDKDADGNMPREPVNMAAQSDRMSPNILVVTTTSNCLGLRTNCMAALSTYMWLSSTSG